MYFTTPTKPRRPAPDYFDTIAMKAAARQAAVERELVTAIFAARHQPQIAEAVAMAEAAGIAPQSFDQEDLRLLYVAASLANGRDMTVILKAARLALIHFGFWDDSAAWHTTGAAWSFENLAWLVIPGSPHRPVEMIAMELVSIARAQRDASEHIEYARRLLSEVA